LGAGAQQDLLALQQRLRRTRGLLQRTFRALQHVAAGLQQDFGAGLQQVLAAGLQQVLGAGLQQDFTALQQRLNKFSLGKRSLGKRRPRRQQSFEGAQQVLGAGLQQVFGAGLQQVLGAGLQQLLGAESQQPLFLLRKLNSPASALEALTEQTIKAAVKLIHFILGIS